MMIEALAQQPLLLRNYVAMHVRAEDFRYDDGAVGLLVVLEDRGDGTADSQAGAVQGVDKFRFRFRRAAEADVSPTCLEIFRIGAMLIEWLLGITVRLTHGSVP